MHFLGHSRSAQFHLPDDRLGAQPRHQPETDAPPSCRSVLNPNPLTGCHPFPRYALRQIQLLFIGILQHQHPPDKERHDLLRWNTVGCRIARDPGYLTRRPAPPGVGMIPMGVEKQKKLLDAIQSQQRLRVPIRDETQNLTSIFLKAPNVGYNSERGRTVGPHAVDYLVREARWQHVSLKQFRIRTVRPLLRARPLFLPRLAKSEGTHRGELPQRGESGAELGARDAQHEVGFACAALLHLYVRAL